MDKVRVVVWGYPLHTHTHSYVHACWAKAFAHLGHEVHWFHDGAFPDPAAFDYANCLFITEAGGGADANIPLVPSSTYIVHACVRPERYRAAGVRFIDLRYHVAYLYDAVYAYSLDAKVAAGKATPVAPGSPTYYEPDASAADLSPAHRACAGPGGTYEALYMYWATDLLPHEFRYEDRFLAPAVPWRTTFVGSIGGANRAEIERFARECQALGVRVDHIDPWRAPVSFEEGRRLTQESVIAPDIRGDGDPASPHKTIGYVPCRLFKNISYGKLGATNAPRLARLFGEHVLFREDEAELARACMERRGDHDYVLSQMRWVAARHTYLNRAADLLAAVAKPR